MPKKPLEAIEEHFSKVTDPRKDCTKAHKLIDIITIANCAVICGAEGWTDMEHYGNSKLHWLKTFLELPNGIPSHDTFGRVFGMIDARQFQLAFWEWVWAVNDMIQGQVINIDGKCLRGSDDQKLGKRAIYMVSAWAAENEIVLGQRKVDEKSNEITAIPELLKILAISGCIVAIDAMGTQTTIAKTIIEAQADYVLSVKENQGRLLEDIATVLAVDQARDFKYASYEYKRTTNKGHGRIDIRECWSTSNPAYLRLIRGLENWRGGAQYCHGDLYSHHRRQGNKTGALLHHQFAQQCRTNPSCGSQTLVYRKQTALGVGCRFERRSQPCSQRPGSRKPGRATPHCSQLAQTGENCQRWHSCQTTASRLER